jgi:hypothetical protein
MYFVEIHVYKVKSKNATLEFTNKEIQLYCVRKQTVQLRSTRLDFWQRIAILDIIDLYILDIIVNIDIIKVAMEK